MRTYKTVRGLLSNPKRWTKGVYEHDGAFCMVGAVGKLTMGNSATPLFGHPAIAKMAAAIIKLFPRRAVVSNYRDAAPYTLVTRFNDHPRTSHADLLKVLKEAAV